MIVTIFGATGMVGAELIRNCQALGYSVRAFGRNIESLIDEDLRKENFEAIKKQRRYERLAATSQLSLW